MEQGALHDHRCHDTGASAGFKGQEGDHFYVHWVSMVSARSGPGSGNKKVRNSKALEFTVWGKADKHPGKDKSLQERG